MHQASNEKIAYDVIVLCDDASSLLVELVDGIDRLPRVWIVPQQRVAYQISTCMRERHQIACFVLGYRSTEDGGLAFCRPLKNMTRGRLSAKPTATLASDMFPDEAWRDIEKLREGRGLSDGHFSTLRWIDEAIRWVEEVYGARLSTISPVEQLSCRDRTALLCFPLEDGAKVWLKATDGPNAHERKVTSLLAALSTSDGNEGSAHVPKVLAEHQEWNAWLMLDAGDVFDDLRSEDQTCSALIRATTALARLQIQTVGKWKAFRETGAFAHFLSVLRSHAAELFDYVREAMPLQVSQRVAPLSRERIDVLEHAVGRVCDVLDTFALPNSVLHGDLNGGNIAIGTNIQFLDWSEAYYGCCALSLEPILLLNPLPGRVQKEALDQRLRLRYAEEWSAQGMANLEAMKQAIRYCRFLSPFSALYGRGDWWRTDASSRPATQAYARTLARRMDQSERELGDSEGL